MIIYKVRFDLYSTEYSSETRYFMFKVIRFIFLCKYIQIPFQHIPKKLGQWQQKAGTVNGTNKKQLQEHFVTNEVK